MVSFGAISPAVKKAFELTGTRNYTLEEILRRVTCWA
jgi:hypothetical protein